MLNAKNFITDNKGIGGTIRNENKDFYVEEVPLQLPTGNGPNTWIQIEKEGRTTLDVVLDMAKYLSDNGKKMWIRNVLVPGYTDGEEDLQKLSDFISSLKTIDRVEVLPYHTLGVFKWKELGIDYTLEGVSPPDGELIKKANDILKTSEYKGYLNRQ